MNVKLLSLSAPTVVARNATHRMTQYDATFEANGFGGNAVFSILENLSSPPTHVDVLLNRSIPVRTDVSTISDFSVVEGGGEDMVLPLGAPGSFFFCGRITEHVFTGQGSMFQAGDAQMYIPVKMLPQDSLEVAPGTRVSFRAEGFSLSI